MTGLGTNLDGLDADAVKKSTDLVDNLTTANSQKALTANQGKVLMDMLSNLEVAITRNTTGWTRNYTRVYKIGRLVVVEVYTTGEVTVNTTIATGLPIPLGSTAPVAMCTHRPACSISAPPERILSPAEHWSMRAKHNIKKGREET